MKLRRYFRSTIRNILCSFIDVLFLFRTALSNYPSQRCRLIAGY